MDDLPTWSIVCFFLQEPYRGRGVFRRLVTLAVDYARACGAGRIEAYPRELHTTGPYACMGIAEVYRSISFCEIARRKEYRPVLRLELASN
ncbi:MAG: GNAT family N-acetyltransferase [Acidobacteria bacterium]|nr:GNAT family N-acetyltransferase [Acidobacteriota bacterium]